MIVDAEVVLVEFLKEMLFGVIFVWSVIYCGVLLDRESHFDKALLMDSRIDSLLELKMEICELEGESSDFEHSSQIEELYAFHDELVSDVEDEYRVNFGAVPFWRTRIRAALARGVANSYWWFDWVRTWSCL